MSAFLKGHLVRLLVFLIFLVTGVKLQIKQFTFVCLFWIITALIWQKPTVKLVQLVFLIAFLP